VGRVVRLELEEPRRAAESFDSRFRTSPFARALRHPRRGPGAGGEAPGGYSYVRPQGALSTEYATACTKKNRGLRCRAAAALGFTRGSRTRARTC